jgi:VCBS repeat-containing protein
VLTNDTDPDAVDTKTVTAVAGLSGNVGANVTGSYGTLHLNGDGTYTYTVDNAATAVNALASSLQTVTDIFTYTMADAAGLTSSSSLTVTIHGANDAPVAVADTASATEASGQNNATAGVNPSGNVLTNDTDVDTGDTRTVSAVAGLSGNVGAGVIGSHGTLHLNGDGTYTYAVNNADTAVNALNIGGTLTDTFTYTVKDAAGLTSNSSLTVTINGADDSPTGFDFTLAPGGATVDNGANLNAGGLIGTFTALGDPDGGSVTFDPLTGTNANLFSFNQATGALSVGGANISGGTYTATITAHEGANVFQQTVKVWVAGSNGQTLSGTNSDIDIMYGQNGNDTLSGNTGSDALIGGQNNDTLTGGAGNDQLVGSGNNDKFVFNFASEGLDHIFDFGAAGTDEIDFNHLAFGNLATGNTATGTLDASHFASNAGGTATAATAQFVYNTTTSILYYDVDGTGAGGAIAMAKLENAFVLHNTDIHLI